MTRGYKKRLRADHEKQTRQRIVEALLALHSSIGPSRTTVRAVADYAGVQRATVYRHFPDEPSMFAACSGHWATNNPLPDPAAWSAIDDDESRTRTALSELYSFYGRNEQLLINLFRDASLVANLRPAMQVFVDYMDAAIRAVAARPRPSKFLRGAIGHALSFSTWRSLTRQQELPASKAILLMTSMVQQARG